MKVIVFDSETTGLTNADEIIQLAAIQYETETNCITNICNFYCDPAKVISKGAINTHGIDNKMLWYLSGGKHFGDYVDKYPWFFDAKETLFAGYQVLFDTRMVNQTLCNNGFMDMNFGHHLDTIPSELIRSNATFDVMAASNKMSRRSYNIKLEACMAEHFPGYNREDYSRKLKRLLDKYDCFNDVEITAHNAIYDAFITLLLFAKFINKINM